MAPENDNPDMGEDNLAGQPAAEDAVENEVGDIISTKGGEPRSFAPAVDVDTGDKPTDETSGQKDADSQPVEADKHVDKQLDHGLKETFPASDPVSINPGAD